MRGRSYTPSPPRGYGRRGRSPSPRGRYDGGRGLDLPTSLLVRNIRLDIKPEALRRHFGEFGPLKDVYLPKDYYTGEPRGFGFVQYVDPADAAEAKYQMSGEIFYGRELTVVFAEENRKKPTEMRAREHRGPSYDRRRSPPRYSRSRRPSHHSRSPPRHRSHSRSVSPQERRYSRERSYSPQAGERSYSRSPSYNGLRSRSQSPIKGPPISRCPSPRHPDYSNSREVARTRSRSRSQ